MYITLIVVNKSNLHLPYSYIKLLLYFLLAYCYVAFVYNTLHMIAHIRRTIRRISNANLVESKEKEKKSDPLVHGYSV